MAKKFGKFLLFTAAVGTAAAAAYYYVQKKDTANTTLQDDDDDYDDFSDDFDDDNDAVSRNYVPLSREGQNAQEDVTSSSDSAEAESVFTPLAKQVAQAGEKIEETVEEFFDEESTDEEPPIQDN